VITSSLNAAVNAHRVSHAKSNPQVPVFNTHELQLNQYGTCHAAVPSTVLSGTTTMK
jgi:hypothetical protein